MKSESNTTGDLIRELPQNERPREKLRLYGVSSLSNVELLAILIGKGTKKASALSLAQQVLALEPEGISYLSDIATEELCTISGMGTAKSCQIVAAIELGRRIATTPRNKSISIETPAMVADLFMEEMRYFKKEVFRVLLLDTKNQIIAREDISVGNLNSSIVHPREVFHNAVKKSASSILLVHNHPSGNPQPSQNDKDITVRLAQAGELLGINVLDHLVIGDGVFVSMKEIGLL
ncbi:MAG: RadC family protein [Anaerovoracaceae bacterium]|jgi:DNA repair protein RadC